MASSVIGVVRHLVISIFETNKRHIIKQEGKYSSGVCHPPSQLLIPCQTLIRRVDFLSIYVAVSWGHLSSKSRSLIILFFDDKACVSRGGADAFFSNTI
jgi:hypothetical protein